MRHDIGLREERIIRSKNEADSFARISSILTVLFIMMMINLQITLVASEPVPINYSLNSSNNDVFSAYNIIPNMSNITYENIRITPELNFTVQEIFSNQNLSSNAIRHLSIGFTDASQYALDLSNDYELWISYGLSKQIVISKYKYFGTLKFPINYDASNPGYYQFQLIGKNDNTIVASTFYYDDD